MNLYHSLKCILCVQNLLHFIFIFLLIHFEVPGFFKVQVHGGATLPQLQLSLLVDREAVKMNESQLDGVSISADPEFKFMERKLMCFGLPPAMVNLRANSLKALMLHQFCQWRGYLKSSSCLKCRSSLNKGSYHDVCLPASSLNIWL